MASSPATLPHSLVACASDLYTVWGSHFSICCVPQAVTVIWCSLWGWDPTTAGTEARLSLCSQPPKSVLTPSISLCLMHGEGWMGQNRLPKHGDYELEAGPEEYSQCASIIVTECLFHIKQGMALNSPTSTQWLRGLGQTGLLGNRRQGEIL